MTPDDRTPAPRQLPPHSLEAEQSVLGGLLLDDRAWDDVADRLEPADFYRPAHRLIFEVMRELAGDTQPIDVVTVSEAIRTRGLLEKSGGVAYLAELAEATPTASNVRAYAGIVAELAARRQVVGAVTGIAETVLAPGNRTSAELLKAAERAVFAIAERGLRDGGPEPIGPHLDAAEQRIRRLAQGGGGLTGLATGFADLDERTAGLQPADLVVVAGRPSMGKTALAVNIAEHALLADPDDRRPVLVFSLEQPAEQLTLRLLSSLGALQYDQLRRGRLAEDDWPRLAAAIKQLSGQPLYIDDAPALTPNALRARARRVTRAAGPAKLIIVDYLQLMRTHGEPENRTLEIAEMTRALKALAKEMQCPLVALSQLNRSLESREDKRPRMSDLRESGAIEQDADVILFIYRDEVYDPETTRKGIAELIIAKQRNGPIGTVELRFTGTRMKFESSDAASRDDAPGTV